MGVYVITLHTAAMLDIVDVWYLCHKSCCFHYLTKTSNIPADKIGNISSGRYEYDDGASLEYAYWPTFDGPDYSVYCECCGDLIHEYKTSDDDDSEQATKVFNVK